MLREDNTVENVTFENMSENEWIENFRKEWNEICGKLKKPIVSNVVKRRVSSSSINCFSRREG